MISKILSNAYAHLDSLDKKKDRIALESRRNIPGNWPDLEAALFEWQQWMEDNKAIITQEILKNKAGEFWKALPQYADTEEPKWSNGWLERFQK